MMSKLSKCPKCGANTISEKGVCMNVGTEFICDYRTPGFYNGYVANDNARNSLAQTGGEMKTPNSQSLELEKILIPDDNCLNVPGEHCGSCLADFEDNYDLDMKCCNHIKWRDETIQAITALMENEKTPEGVSPPDKVLYLNTTIDGVLNQYDIRHPKPSISRNTARKMLKRDLTALQDAEIEYVLGGVDVALEAYTGSGIITGYTEYLKSVLRQRYQERRSNG